MKRVVLMLLATALLPLFGAEKATVISKWDAVKNVSFWGSLKLNNKKGNEFTIDIKPGAKPWCGFRAMFATPCTITEAQVANAVLSFEINGASDLNGKHKGGANLQVSLGKATPKLIGVTNYVSCAVKIDDDQSTFQKVSISLKKYKFLSAFPAEVNMVSFQYKYQIPQAGVTIKNIKIESF